MINRKAVTLVLAVCMAVGACGSPAHGTADKGRTGEAAPAFERQITKEYSGNVRAEAEVIFPETAQNGTCLTAQLRKEGIFERADELAGIASAGREPDSVQETERGEQLLRDYTYEDGEAAASVSSNGIFRYVRMRGVAVRGLLVRDKIDPRYNAEAFVSDEDLGGFSKEEAWQKVRDLLGDMGVSVPAESTECYRMEHEKMAEEEARMADIDLGFGTPDAEPTEWTEADDCWYFITHGEWEGMRVLPELSGEGIDPENVEVLVSADGILYLNVFGYAVLESSGETAIRAPGEAVEKLAGQLKEIMTEEDYVITGVELCQLLLDIDARDGYDGAHVIPVWNCHVRIGGDSPYSYVREYRFDARTMDIL